MKKCLLAILLCLAVCFCACAATADPEGPEVVLQIREDNAETVVFNEQDGSVSVPMHQWINFIVYAPENNGVDIYCVDEIPKNLTETDTLADHLAHQYDNIASCWPGDQGEEFTWTPNDLPDDYGPEAGEYTKYIVAEAHYEQWTVHRRTFIKVTVDVGEAIDPPTYTVPDEYEYTAEDNYPIVARDGRFYIDVDNDDADYYGAYICREGIEQSSHYWDWLADSHWIGKADGDTTRIAVPVTACEPGDYAVHVYAIKFGAPQEEAAQTATIHVDGVANQYENCPVIVSMEEEYISGEPLMIYAYYTNPDEIEGWIELNIRPQDDPRDVVYARGGEFNDFWDMDARCWTAGAYNVYIEIWTNGDNGPYMYDDIGVVRSFRITSDGQVADIGITPEIPVSLIKGDNLVLQLSAVGDGENIVSADSFEISLNRIDWDWSVVDWRRADAVNGEATITFDGNSYYFEEGAAFNVEIRAVRNPETDPDTGETTAYDMARISFQFAVVSGEEQPAVLTLTGIDENGEIPINRNFQLTVTKAEDTEIEGEIRTIRVCGGYGYWNDEGLDRDGSFVRDLGYNTPGIYAVFARVTFDDPGEDFDWEHNEDPRTWYTTNIVPVTATKAGNIGPFTYTIDCWNAETGKAEAERGQIAEVSYTAAEHATHYWIDIDHFNEERNEWEGFRRGAELYLDEPAEDETAGTAYLMTTEFAAGQRYRISAAADSEGYSAYSLPEQDLVITEPGIDEGFIFNVDVPADGDGARTLVTGQEYQLSAYAPGADWIDVYFDYENYNFERDEGWRKDWRGDSFSAQESYGNSGTYKLIATAWYPRFEDGAPVMDVDEQGNEYHVHDGVDSEPIILNVTATGGNIEIARPEGLPAYIIAGTNDDVEFTVIKPENADHYDVEAWCDMEDGFLYGNGGFSEDSRTITISADRLPQFETRIHVKVRASGYNVEANEQEWYVPVVQAVTDDVILAISGLDENNGITVNTEAELTIAKAENTEGEIRTVCVYDEYGPREHEGPDEDGVYRTHISFEHEGTYLVFAQVTFDEVGEDFDWDNNPDPRRWFATNAVEVTVTKLGDVGEFTFDVDCGINDDGCAEAERGQMITVTYHAAEYATHYWIDVERYNDGNGNWDWIDHAADLHTEAGDGEGIAGTATLPTAGLEAEGRYRIKACADGSGYSRYTTGELPLTITEPEEGSIIFTVDVPENEGTRTLETAEEYMASVYAPGAGWIEVFFDYHEEDNPDEAWRDDNRGGDHFFRDNCSYGNAGTYTLIARAHYGEGEGEGWHETGTKDSEPIVIEITSCGAVINIPRPEDLPAYIVAGTEKDLEFTVNRPEMAGDYGVDVWYEVENGSLYGNGGFREDSRKITISADRLPRFETTIHVKVRASGYNVEANEHEWYIPVVQADTDDVILAISGLDDNAQIPVNRKAQVTITKAQGAEGEIRTVCLYEQYGPRDHEGPDDDGVYRTETAFDNEGTYSIFALVTFDEVGEDFDWDNNQDPRRWYATNAVEVTATKRGDIGEFTFDVNCEINETFNYAEAERGQLITVTYQDAEYATHYWIDVERYNDGNGNWDWVCHEADLFTEPGDGEGTAGTATLPTAELEVGYSYRIRALAEAEGYTRYTTDELHLELAEPENGGIIFNVDAEADENGKINLITGQNLLLSAYAPGADWIDIYFDYDHYDFEKDEGWRDDNHGGDSFSTFTAYGNSGTYKLIATAWYPEFNGDGDPIWETNEDGTIRTDDEGNNIHKHSPQDSDEIIVNVTATGGNIELTRPEGLPAYIIAGTNDDVEFTVIKPENADHYDVEAWCDMEDGGLYFNYGIENGRTAVKIDAGRLPNWENAIHVRVRADGYNMEGADWQWHIPIVPATTGNVTITLDGQTGEVEMPVGRNAELKVEKAANVQKDIRTVCIVGEYGHWDHEGPDEDGTYTRGCSFDNAGVYGIYAMVTFDEVEDGYDFENNPDPRVWYTTNVIEVTATKTGDANPFTIELSDTEVTRGERIFVTINEPEGDDVDPELNAGNIWINIDRMDASREWGWVDENQTAEVFTTNLRPGEYWLWASGNGEGLGKYDTEPVKFTVTDPQMNEKRILFTINGAAEDAEAQLYEKLLVSVIAPGATRVGFIEDGHPWHLNEAGDYLWGEGSDSWFEYLYWVFGNDVGTHEVKAAAWFNDEEEWVYSEPLTVTITKEGDLAFNTLEIPPYFLDEDDDENATEQFTISMPENGDWMRIFIERATETGDDEHPWNTRMLVDEAGLKNDYTVEIPHNQLEAGDEIWITIEAYGLGYAADYMEFHVPVLPVPSADASLIFEEPGPDENNEALLNQELAVALVPDDGHELSAVRFNDGRGFWEEGAEINSENNPNMFREDDGAFAVSLSYHDKRDIGLRAIYAYYRLDGNEEWLMALPLVVNVTALGTVGEYDFADDQPANVYAFRGDDVTFSLGEAENADYYWIDAFSGEEDNWHGWAPELDVEGTTVTMRTDGLPAGVYEIWGRAGKDGWIWSESNSCVTLTVVDLQIARTELETLEEMEWSVDAPGALHITAEGYAIDENEQKQDYFLREEDEAFISGTNGFGAREGTAYMDVTVTFGEDAIITRATEITVTAPNGNLEAPKISSKPWKTGTDLNLEIVPDANAQGYTVCVFDATEGHGENYYETADEAQEYGTKKITLAYNKVKNAGIIGVAVYQSAQGYNDCYTEIIIRPIDAAKLFTLPSGLTEIEDEAFAYNPAITHVIIPSGVVSIGDRAFSGCDGLLTIEFQGMETTFGEDAFVLGDVTIYGHSGSDAETYAVNNGISFVSID